MCFALKSRPALPASQRPSRSPWPDENLYSDRSGRSPLPLDFDGAFVKGSLYSWIARDNAKPGRTAYESWVAQASNAWSQEHIDLTYFEIEPILLKAFKDLTGFDCDLYQSHLWRYAKLESPSELNYVFDEHIRVGLCGDWLKHSTVEGAWLSGYQMAQYLISIT